MYLSWFKSGVTVFEQVMAKLFTVFESVFLKIVDRDKLLVTPPAVPVPPVDEADDGNGENSDESTENEAGIVSEVNQEPTVEDEVVSEPDTPALTPDDDRHVVGDEDAPIVAPVVVAEG